MPTTIAPTATDESNKPTSPALTPTISSPHLNLGGVIRSEWTKLRSVRSTWWTLLATFAIMVGLGALLCAAFVSRFDGLDPGDIARFDPTAHSLRGLFLAQLTIGVLGVLAITNEYATGMIRNTFAAVPQRRAVLAAKALVFGVVALVVGLTGSFATLFAMVLVLPILAKPCRPHGTAMSRSSCPAVPAKPS